MISTVAKDAQREQLRRENVKEYASTYCNFYLLKNTILDAVVICKHKRVRFAFVSDIYSQRLPVRIKKDGRVSVVPPLLQ